ncbi:MAG: cupin domain-containing protein [Nitrospinota bacterium]
MAHYVVNVKDVEPAPVEVKDGWNQMDIRLVVEESRSGSKEVCFWRTVFRPDARHYKHRHTRSDEVIYVIRGRGASGAEDREVEVKAAGDVHFISKNTVHWMRNLDPKEELEVCGCYTNTGTLEGSGYVFESEVTNADMTIR